MIEDSSSLCRTCLINKATHMCEDCGTMLCTECLESKSYSYQVCVECHHVIDRLRPGEKNDECPECESGKLSMGKRNEDVCPRCHSTRVVSIEERRRNLAQEMRTSIMGIQYGHTRLRELVNGLISAKRQLVSLRMANFLHYRWLEDKIEGLHKEILAIKERVSNQAEIVAKQVVAETKNLIDYTAWTPDQFPFVEGVTHRVMEISNQYKQNVDEALGESKIILNDVQKQLDGLNYYRTRFVAFYELAQLSVNELPVCALPDIKIHGSDFLRTDRTSGTLFITNKRMLFFAEIGIVRKRTEIIFDFPLVYLNSIEEDGRFRKRLVFRMKQGAVKISCNDQTKKVLPDYLEIAKKFDRYMQTDLQRVRRLEQADISISDVRLKIEGLIYSILTSEIRPIQQKGNNVPRYRIDPPTTWSRSWTSAPQYQSAGYYRDHPEDSIDRVDADQRYSISNPHNPELDTLRRDAIAIDKALKETVHLLRDGRLVPEDFIRRYRGLIRDSYDTRRRMGMLSRSTNEYNW